MILVLKILIKLIDNYFIILTTLNLISWLIFFKISLIIKVFYNY